MADDVRTIQVVRTALVAAVLAVVGAVGTVGFVRAFDALHDLLWVRLPDALGTSATAAVFVVPICTIGGFLVGVCRHYLGEWPLGLEESIQIFREEKAFDVDHLAQAFLISLLSLGFGAALGPEAALTALIGGVCTWVARVIKADAASRDSVTYIGLIGALGGLFGAAGAAALPLDDPEREKPRRILLVIPGLAAALGGAWVFRNLSGSGSYFDLDLQPYTFAVADLAWLFLPLAAAFVVALVFMVATKEMGTVLARVPNRVVQTTVSGLGLGLLAAVSSYALFSGHESIHEIDVDPSSHTTASLIGIALIKVLATAVCLGGGWKGGRFFPMMFVGSAVGLGISLAATSVNGTLAIAVGMTAAVAVLLRKPVIAIVLVLFFFPPALSPAIIVTGLVAGTIAKQLEARTAFSRFC